MKKLVIDRSRWLRGKTEGTLLDDEGQMCCLGFESRRIGLTVRDIRHGGTITGLPCWSGSEERQHIAGQSEFPGWLESRLGGEKTMVGYSSCRSGFPMDSVEDALTIINDCPDIDDPTRETWLTEGFRVLGGIEVEFVDGPVP